MARCAPNLPRLAEKWLPKSIHHTNPKRKRGSLHALRALFGSWQKPLQTHAVGIEVLTQVGCSEPRLRFGLVSRVASTNAELLFPNAISAGGLLSAVG